MNWSAFKKLHDHSLGNVGGGGYYPNFDTVRLLLAIQVVAIHSGAFSFVWMNPVPAFLAIGGFVVLGSVERNSPAQFFVNRALRILPLLFLSFIFVWISFDFHAMIKNIVFWLFPFGEPPVNPVVWSLMYEELYYGILVIFCVLGVYRWKFAPVLLSIVFGFCAVQGYYFGLPSHLFVLGCAFFLGNSAYIFRIYLRRVNKWLSFSLLIVSLYFISRMPYGSAAFPGRLLMDFLGFAAMLLFAISGPQLPRLKVDLSYSIYLIHCLVLALLVYFIPLGTERLFWVMLLCTLPISYACWIMIEKPAMKLRYRVLKFERGGAKTDRFDKCILPSERI